MTLWAIELQEEVVVDNGVLTDKDKQPVRTKSADLTVHENGALTNTENIAIRTRSADYTVGSDGRMVNDEGAVVQTKSADFAITEDGTMVQVEANSAQPVKVGVKAPRHDIEVLDWAGSFETTCEKATTALSEFKASGMSSVLLDWRDLSDESGLSGSTTAQVTSWSQHSKALMGHATILGCRIQGLFDLTDCLDTTSLESAAKGWFHIDGSEACGETATLAEALAMSGTDRRLSENRRLGAEEDCKKEIKKWFRQKGLLGSGDAADACDYEGVTCSGGAVTALFLSNRGLTGKLPQGLAHCQNLEIFDVSSNSLRGTVPVDYAAHWTNIKQIKLAGNSLRVGDGQAIEVDTGGDIGDAFSALCDEAIRQSALKWTSGSVAGSACGISWVTCGGRKGLDVVGVDFQNAGAECTDCLPDELGFCRMMDRFVVSGHGRKFKGKLPSSLMSWTQITEFDVHGNQLNGKLPYDYAAWTAIEYFDVHDNRLQGYPNVVTKWKETRDKLKVILGANNFLAVREVMEACDGTGDFTCELYPQRKDGEQLCFSGSSTVQTLAGERPIGELGPSTVLESSRDFHALEHDRWLWDVHGSLGTAQAAVRAEFLALTHAASDRALRVTESHFVFAKKQGALEARMVPASAVSVGDELLVRHPEKPGELMPSRVTGIETVLDFGVYAPFTWSGRLMVDGVLVSNYATYSAALEDTYARHTWLPWERLMQLLNPFRYAYGP